MRLRRHVPFVPSAPVLATFILRLVPAALHQGSLVGRVECVETGEGRTCHHLDELLAFLRTQCIPQESTIDGDDR